MQYDVLGPLRVRDGDRRVSVTGPLRRQLLGLLLAHRNEPVRADQLAESLWTAGAPRSGSRLQLLVHKLRKALGDPSRIGYADGAYRLRTEPGEVDAEEFERLMAHARACDDVWRRAAVLRDALALWRGAAYEDLDVVELEAARHRLDELRLDAREALLRAELDAESGTVDLEDLARLTAEHPARESFPLLLMTALYRRGRRTDALQSYQRARRASIAELGLEPGKQLRSAHQRLLLDEDPLGNQDIGPPRQLPPVVDGFVGRAAELAALDALGSAPVVLVTGAAGVGKTALVTRWAQQHAASYPDGQLYADLRGFGPDNPLPAADALRGFLQALGVDARTLPRGLDALAARWRTETADRRLLVVLDNAADSGHARPLLPSSPTARTLVTSRDRCDGLVVRDGANLVELERFSWQDAQTLFDRMTQVDIAPAARDRVIERCARLPLALRVAAEQLRRTDELTDFLDDVEDDRRWLSLLDTGDAQSSVRAVLASSYRRLDREAARLFRCFGMRPGPEVDGYELTALHGGSDVSATLQLLDVLVRAHLVEQAPRRRFRQHDLLWAFAAELAASDSVTQRAAAIGRLQEFYLYAVAAAVGTLYQDGGGQRSAPPPPATPVPRWATSSDAEEWLQLTAPNMLAAAHPHLDSGGYAARLAAAFDRHLRRRGRHSDALQLHAHALQAAREHGDRENEQAALFGLAHAERMTGSYDLADEHFGRALEVARELDYRYGEMSALGGLADTLLLAGRHDEADGHYRMMREVASANGYRLGELKAYAGQGHCARFTCRADDARRYYERSIDIAHDIDDESATMVGTCGLGDVERLLGRRERAGELYAEVLANTRRFGHRVGEADALLHVADLAAEGDAEFADRTFCDSLEVSREVGHALLQVLALTGRARIARRVGALDEATELLGQARRIAEQIGAPMGEFETRHGLGRLATAMGEPAEALQHHRVALRVATAAGQPRDQARAYEGLASAYGLLGVESSARAHWSEALDRYMTHGLPEADRVQRELAAYG